MQKILFIILFPIISFGQNVNIPDANFKNYLVNNTDINTNGDSEIQLIEASSYSGTINCGWQNISDLTGIETFSSLTQLFCFNNQLTSLDLSSNNAINTVECTHNQLTSLNVSGCSALIQLRCSNNQLTSLNLSSNSALNILHCTFNQISSLDLSSNNVLHELYCSNNQLTFLDLSSNNSLTNLNCAFNNLNCLNLKNRNNIIFSYFLVYNNPNLTCIEVDDVNSPTVINWINDNSNIDPQHYFSEDCNNACSNTSSISELKNTPKQLIMILDILGRETPFKSYTPLLYIYNNGKVERKMIIKK